MTAPRILLVEDDVLMGLLLAEMLAELGYGICGLEATEAAAVAAAARHKPDLIIADVILAKGNGITAVERITRAGPVPHVFVTGHGLHVPVPGAVVLRKPFREAELVGAIERAFGTAGALAHR